MRDEEFRLHAELEDHHWWFVVRRGIIADLLRRVVPAGGLVAEIGCGTGGNLRSLSRTFRTVGCDVSPTAVSLARELSGPIPVVEGDFADALAPWRERVDAVLLADVIEHVDDDREFLRRVAGFVPSGGVVLITVPALPWLFGPHDRALGHRRRYTLPTLREVARSAGLTEIHATYAFCLFLPLIALLRLTGGEGSSLKRHHPLVNLLCRGAGELERRILRVMPLPVGSSLVTLWRRE